MCSLARKENSIKAANMSGEDLCNLMIMQCKLINKFNNNNNNNNMWVHLCSNSSSIVRTQLLLSSQKRFFPSINLWIFFHIFFFFSTFKLNMHSHEYKKSPHSMHIAHSNGTNAIGKECAEEKRRKIYFREINLTSNNASSLTIMSCNSICI